MKKLLTIAVAAASLVGVAATAQEAARNISEGTVEGFFLEQTRISEPTFRKATHQVDPTAG